MTSVWNSRVAMRAVAAALGVFAGGFASANAADLGGNCCADLEERIAELEATTARKGNRKVSLTVSGWVNEAIFFWDDGVEKNAYIGTNSLEQSRFRFVGDAKIDGDWSAGYTLEIGVSSHPSSQWDQDSGGRSTAAASNPTSLDNSLVVRKSNWYVKSKTFGKLTVGLEGTATYHLLDDADGTNTRNVSDFQADGSYQARFRLLSGGSRAAVNNLRWGDVMRGVDTSSVGQNGRRDVVRYDSPEIMGFVVTASWGEDDMWGGALTFKKKLGDFKVVAKAGYEHSSDETVSTCSANGAHLPNQGLDCEWFGAGATIMHEPTGLFVYGAYGEQRDDSEKAGTPTAEDRDRTWFIQAGIEKAFSPLGTTTVFGQYRHDDGGSNVGATFTGVAADYLHDSSIDFWSAGVVQNISSAAMDLYVLYRHAEGDMTSVNGNSRSIDDFDMIITGARIQF